MLINELSKDSFLKKVKENIEKKLPGKESQFKMLPEGVFFENYHPNPNGAKQSAVLLLLFEVDDQLKTVFIKRNTYDGIHSGQISLPGGGFEEHDNSLIDTALREAYEEIGIDIRKISVIGCLSRLYVPPSNFSVLPVIGIYEGIPEFIPDSTEVHKVITVDINYLLNPANVEFRLMKSSLGFLSKAPGWAADDDYIWGATAMILSEFVDVMVKS